MPLYTIHNLYAMRREILTLSDRWRQAVGDPELTGTWFVYGASKNGKTSLSAMLAKELSRHGRVLYNSIEEGAGLTLVNAFKRAGITPSDAISPAGMDLKEMIKALSGRNAARFIFVDSIQFSGWTVAEYKHLKALFKNRIFIYVSHVSGGKPEGSTALTILRDASVIFRVEGFRAFPTSRFGGGQTIDVSARLAGEYWGTSAPGGNSPAAIITGLTLFVIAGLIRNLCVLCAISSAPFA